MKLKSEHPSPAEETTPAQGAAGGSFLQLTTSRLSRLFRHAESDALMLALFRAVLEYRTGRGR